MCGLERNTLLFRVWCIIKLYDSHSHICFSFVTEMYQCVRILWCITFILTVIISIDGKKLYVITNVFYYFNNVLWLFIKFSTLTQCDINKYFQIFLFWKRSRHTERESDFHQRFHFKHYDLSTIICYRYINVTQTKILNNKYKYMES